MTAPANLGRGDPAGPSAPTLILGCTAQLNIFPLGEHAVTPPAPAFPTPAAAGGVCQARQGYTLLGIGDQGDTPPPTAGRPA
jgi:hypothetical protein